MNSQLVEAVCRARLHPSHGHVATRAETNMSARIAHAHWVIWLANWRWLSAFWKLQWCTAYDLPDRMDARISTKMLPFRTVINFFIQVTCCHQLEFVMPSSTKSSLELPTYPPEYKDLLTELYSMGVPQIAEKIFTLLNPADLCSCLQVCTTWNYQVSTRPKFMDKVNAYHRQCKENAENLHVAKKRMEFIVFPTQRQPLDNFTPNTLTQIQTNEIHSAPISFKCSKPTWHKSECSGRVSLAKRPRQPEDICGTKKSKKRLRRLWRSRDSDHTCSK